MEQVYIFKNVLLPENTLVLVSFPGVAHDGRAAHAIFQNDSSLTSYQTVKHVYSKHFIPWMKDTRFKVTGAHTAEMVCLQDSDPEQYRYLEDTIPVFNLESIRAGTLSASQTTCEQDEDAAVSFKDVKAVLKGFEAEQYRREHPRLEKTILDTILSQDFKISGRLAQTAAATIVRMQYAHSECFSFSKTVAARRKTGHHPVNIDRLFDNHPGMKLVAPDVKAWCKSKIPELKRIYDMTGYLTESHLDEKKIPETEEQEKKRRKKQNVKMGSPCGWKSRFTWLNHDNTVIYRQEQQKKILETKQKKEEKKRLQDLDTANLTKYSLGQRTPAKDIPRTMQRKYDFKPQDDMKCTQCNSWWSTWVSLDLRTGKRVWKTPDDLAAEPIWYCGLKNCLAVCALESKRITAEKKEVKMKAKAARAVSSSSSAVPPAPPGAPRKQKRKTASKNKPIKSKSKPKTKKHTPTAGRGKTGNVTQVERSFICVTWRAKKEQTE